MNKSPSNMILAAFAAALAGCGTGEASIADGAVAEPVRPLAVEVARPEVADIFATYETTATIASDAEAPVLARASGEVVEILVEEGDRVDEGQILARLDGERLRLQMLQARASLDMTSREYMRFVSLRERGLVSAAAVESLKYDVDALMAAWELMRLNYGYTKIRAPISGVVSSRDIKPGTHVENGAPVFRITETSRLVAYLHIPQVELGRIERADEVIMHVDAMPGLEFRATLARISPTIDTRNGTFRATVYLDNDEGLLAPGMFSRFSIACEKYERAMLVPSDAVIREDSESVVYVVNDGIASRRAVSTGIESRGKTQVLDGLHAEDRVIVTGQTNLRDGSSVLASNAAGSPVTG